MCFLRFFGSMTDFYSNLDESYKVCKKVKRAFASLHKTLIDVLVCVCVCVCVRFWGWTFPDVSFINTTNCVNEFDIYINKSTDARIILHCVLFTCFSINVWLFHFFFFVKYFSWCICHVKYINFCRRPLRNGPKSTSFGRIVREDPFSTSKLQRLITLHHDQSHVLPHHREIGVRGTQQLLADTSNITVLETPRPCWKLQTPWGWECNPKRNCQNILKVPLQKNKNWARNENFSTCIGVFVRI